MTVPTTGVAAAPTTMKTAARPTLPFPITIVTSSFYDTDIAGATVTGKALPRAVAQRRRELVIRELSTYPPSLFAKVKLTEIKLCDDLCRSSGDEEPRAVGGAVASATHILYLGRYESQPAEVFRQAIHHEFFHVIQFSVDGDRERGWSSFNAPTFHYAPVIHNSIGIDLIRNGLDGFVSNYATSNSAEDQAETFCCMICSPSIIIERIPSDEVLSRKVQWIKVFCQDMCPEMDEQFWVRVERVSTP